MTTARDVSIIKHIIEPKRLLLSWQSLDPSKSRSRRIIGELVKENDDIFFHYLTNSKDFKLAQADGFDRFPAFHNFKLEYRNDVLKLFMLRLPPKSRTDFNTYLHSLRIPEHLEFSDFALLGYSEARLPSDGFSIIHPFGIDTVPCEFLTEIAGFRHYESINNIEYAAELSFEPEPSNTYDHNAIKVILDNNHIGYVNRGQTEAFNYWIVHNKVRAVIEKKNGTDDRPRVYMFVEVQSSSNH